jgi:predicted nucleic acid-binding protein
MDGVREIIERAQRRELRIITSVITSVEVLSSKIPTGVGTAFVGLQKRIIRQGVDSKIAQLAHDLRDHYAVRTVAFGTKNLSVPDSIHLATAIHYRADEFHTFDQENRKNTLGLIPLSGNIGGHKLTICKPIARNPQLDLRRP